MNIKLILVIMLLSAILLTLGCSKQPVNSVQNTDTTSSNSDLSRLSIKNLPSMESGYTLTEKNEPWEGVKDEVDYAFSQSFVNIKAGKDYPTVVVLDARTYKTPEAAEDAYEKPHETASELGTLTEQNKEPAIIGGKKAVLSLIRPDTGSYAVEILFREGKTVIILLVADFREYKTEFAAEIAEAVAQKI